MYKLIAIDMDGTLLNDQHEVSGKVKETIAEAKKSGVKCSNCGRPIWAIGSALEGWDGCFTCITGESNSSEDYEIDTVN